MREVWHGIGVGRKSGIGKLQAKKEKRCCGITNKPAAVCCTCKDNWRIDVAKRVRVHNQDNNENRQRIKDTQPQRHHADSKSSSSRNPPPFRISAADDVRVRSHSIYMWTIFLSNPTIC